MGLRGYAGKDPLVEYKGEAFKLFENLMASIDYESVNRIYKIQIAPQGQDQHQGHDHVREEQRQVIESSSSGTAVPVQRSAVPSEKIGRNDPCPCGAVNPETNKPYKYKKCGMISAPYHKG